MGGSGALAYCGQRLNYQLIASRRNPQLPGSESVKWGFTIIRRRPPMGNEKNSRFEYLAPRGNIIELNLDEVAILPNKDGQPYRVPISSGTVIKLYEYRLPSATRTVATADFYRAMSTRLWDVVVPVRITETRAYRGHTLQSTLSGMRIRLEDDRGNVLEEGFPCSFTLNIPDVGVVSGQICLFKKDAKVDRWISSREAVIFSVNGQAHGFFSNDLYRRESVKLEWIRRSLLVNVDCSRLNPGVLERLFMTSRDRLRDEHERAGLESALEDFLKHHEGLRYWNEKRHHELIAEHFHEDSEDIRELFEKLVANSPMLASLFGLGNKIKLPQPGKQQVETFSGKHFPTFLRLEIDVNDGQYVKQCPQNSYCRVTLLTDAENDYLDRAYEPGKLIAKPENLVKSTSLYDGRLEIALQPDIEYPVGKRVPIRVILTSPEALEGYFTVEFLLQITEPVSKRTHGTTKPKPPKNAFSALPDIREVYRDGWREDIEISNEDDLVMVVRDNGTVTSFVNMDNKFFKSYVYRDTKRKDIITNLFKLSSTIVGLSIREFVKDNVIEDSNRRSVAAQLGKILLPMVDGLGDIKGSVE